MPKIVDHHERRLAFAEAAFRVIARDGIEGLTVRAIAREAGFTTGALVHYFKSKDQVLILASDYIGIVVRGLMQDNQQAHKGLKALKHVVYNALPLDEERRGNWNVWMGLWQRAQKNREVGNLMQRRYIEWLDRVAMLVEQAQEIGEVDGELDAKAAAHTIVGVVDGIGARVMLVGADIPAKEQQALVDMVIDNLPRATDKPDKSRRKRRGRA